MARMIRLDQSGVVAQMAGRCHLLLVDATALWGVMSAHQAVLHLSAAMHSASSGKPLQSLPSPLKNPVGRFMALRSGVRWPPGVKTVPSLDTVGKPQPDSSRFAEDLAGLRTGLARFAALETDKLSPIHPYFGPMNRTDWMLWAYLHADHHLRQFGC